MSATAAGTNGKRANVPTPNVAPLSIEANHPAKPGPLGTLVRSRLAQIDSERTAVDLVLMANEISFAHGTGILLSRVLEEAPPYILARAFDHWGGSQVVRPVADFVLHAYSQPREVIASFIATRLSPYRVQSIVAIPYTREDVVMTLVAKAMSGAPLTIWIMDDNSILNNGIPAGDMAQLVQAADARFVISDQMRAAYEDRFQCPFWVLPPLVARRFIRGTPTAAPVGEARGCIVGNVWHQQWLTATLEVFRDIGASVEWYTSSEALHFLSFTEADLASAGVRIRAGLTHDEIAARVASSSYVVIPSFSGLETDGHAAAIGRLSLPSKMLFVTASAGVPFLVLTNGASGAAEFVQRFELGEVVTYNGDQVAAAINRLVTKSVQHAVRARSAAIAPQLDVTGLYGFLTQAAREQRLPDDRFEKLFSSVPVGGRETSTRAP